MSTITEFITLTKIDCGQCGASYAINESYRAQKYQEGGCWHCPYCQVGWGYSNNSENAQLQRKLAERERQMQEKERAITEAKCALLRTEQEKEKVERAMRRQTRRIHAGVCPCCKRTFVNLARHMQTKHSEKVPSCHIAK